MKTLLQLTWRSLWNRRGTALLTILAIAVSVALLLGVQKMRSAARESFADTVSGVDLIVGARSGPINLLLYSVFRVGDATANVSWASYQKIAHHRDVAWTIPISLGDGHRGFRVLGTNGDYFRHYQFAGDRSLQFAAGGPFEDLHDAVLGAEVARSLGYELGDEVIVGHGLGSVSFAEHRDQPFHVVGILEPTGTPVDRTVHVSLEAITAIHHAGPHEEEGADADDHGQEQADLTPDSITAFLVRMKDPVMLLQMQRAVNEYRPEALLAIVPGVTLMQLWDVVGIADRALLVVAAFVVLAGLLGMLIAILTSLNERRREMAILRSVGAGPRHVFGLLVAEAGALATLGVATGVALAFALLAIARPLVERRFGLFLNFNGLAGTDLAMLAGIIVAALLMGLVPAWRAYRNALSDGLIPRV
jgi:putative ABC transport system permease protein